MSGSPYNPQDFQEEIGTLQPKPSPETPTMRYAGVCSNVGCNLPCYHFVGKNAICCADGHHVSLEVK